MWRVGIYTKHVYSPEEAEENIKECAYAFSTKEEAEAFVTSDEMERKHLFCLLCSSSSCIKGRENGCSST